MTPPDLRKADAFTRKHNPLVQDNKGLIKQLLHREADNFHATWTDLAAPDFKHTLALPDIADDLAGWLRINAYVAAAFPDLSKEAALLIAEGSYVVEYARFTGTHTGQYGAIPPSGRLFTWTQTNVYEIVCGRITRLHPVVRLERLLTQLKDASATFYEPRPTLLNRVIDGGIRFASRLSAKPVLPAKSGVEYNREIVRKYAIEFKNQQRFMVFPKLYRPSEFRHHFGFSNHRDRLFSFVSVGREFLAGFPDVQVELKALIAEGEYVVEFNYVVGTHRGAYAGIAATGRTVRWSETHIYRLAAGRIVENWPAVNFERILDQIK